MMQPVMRFKELPSQLGSKRTLLELYVPAPTRSVSIVLDMSDSCPPIRDIAQQLPKLLVKHAKQSPLWIYRLSNKLALNEGHQNTVGHLTDGSISLLSWLDDRSLVEKASRTGSTLRRVIESIQERDRNVAFSESLTIVLTDGKLLDRAAIELPPKLRLVGICPEITNASQEHWNRVVPGSPLIAWNSPLLTHSTFDNADLTGKYAVSFVGLDVGTYEYFDPTRKTLQLQPTVTYVGVHVTVLSQ